MNEFTASNGNRIKLEADGWMTFNSQYKSWAPHTVKSVREFFAAERDEEMGVWRDERYPGMFAAPVGSNPDVVQIVKELGGIAYERFDRNKGSLVGPMSGLAYAYFQAHPEAPKLPTELGLYVPASNRNMLASTYIYQLKSGGRWSVMNHADGLVTGAAAKKDAEDAVRRLGGLVRLAVERDQ